VLVPQAVIEALDEIPSYDDVQGQAAATVLDRTGALTTASVALDAEFPLDEGEHCASLSVLQ